MNVVHLHQALHVVAVVGCHQLCLSVQKVACALCTALFKSSCAVQRIEWLTGWSTRQTHIGGGTAATLCGAFSVIEQLNPCGCNMPLSTPAQSHLLQLERPVSRHPHCIVTCAASPLGHHVGATPRRSCANVFFNCLLHVAGPVL
jgi:hypothetical protein